MTDAVDTARVFRRINEAMHLLLEDNLPHFCRARGMARVLQFIQEQPSAVTLLVEGELRLLTDKQLEDLCIGDEAERPSVNEAVTRYLAGMFEAL